MTSLRALMDGIRFGGFAAGPRARATASGLAPSFVAAIGLCALGAAAASCVPAARAAEPGRDFYGVLEDVLGDFEYEVKIGSVRGLKDLSIRDVKISENLPESFKSHLEPLLTQSILRNSKTRVLQCPACRGARTEVEGGRIVSRSAKSDRAELKRVAALHGISSFLDAAFSYQPNGLVLSMTIVDAATGQVAWTRSYNSETSRAAALRRGVDLDEMGGDARKVTEYPPVLQYRAAVLYLFEPNVGGTTGCLGLGFRLVERYDNRKKEVGFELDYLKDSSTLINGPGAATSDNLYSGINLTMVLLHSWNLIGGEEDYNKVRGSVNVGIGGTFAAGFLGSLLRVGNEWRMGKRVTISTTLGYRPASTAFIGANIQDANKVSGLEYGGGVNFLF